MANGAASYQCNNCWHYKYAESGRNCMKYDFVFPKTEYEILCRDYRHRFIKRVFTDPRSFVAALVLGVPALLIYTFTGAWIDEHKKKNMRKELEPNVLYFYAYWSQKPIQPLASFADLHALLIVKHVSIKFDAEYGLSIHFDNSAIADIPDLGKDFEIDIEGSKFRFGTKGGFNILYCKDIPADVQKITYRESALLLAQTELKRYKIIPNYFR